MVEKEFDAWNQIKKGLDRNEPQHLFFHEREVWFCSIGVNVGVERDSRNANFSRPVVIVKKFNQFMFWAVPLSGKTGKAGKYHLEVLLNGESSDASFSQMRLFDRKRLLRRFGMLPKADFEKIKNAIRESL